MINDSNRRYWIATATGVSLALLLADDIMVGVALPTIRDDLGISQLTAQWIVNAYALVFVVIDGKGTQSHAHPLLTPPLHASVRAPGFCHSTAKTFGLLFSPTAHHKRAVWLMMLVKQALSSLLSSSPALSSSSPLVLSSPLVTPPS